MYGILVNLPRCILYSQLINCSLPNDFDYFSIFCTDAYLSSYVKVMENYRKNT